MSESLCLTRYAPYAKARDRERALTDQHRTANDVAERAASRVRSAAEAAGDPAVAIARGIPPEEAHAQLLAAQREAVAADAERRRVNTELAEVRATVSALEATAAGHVAALIRDRYAAAVRAEITAAEVYAAARRAKDDIVVELKSALAGCGRLSQDPRDYLVTVELHGPVSALADTAALARVLAQEAGYLDPVRSAEAA